MKYLFAVLALALMAGCSTVPAKKDVPAENSQSRNAEAVFQEANGNLTLVVDSGGQWVSIKTFATADVASEASSASETALMVATMRAKRNLAEFMNNEIKSTKTTHTISKAITSLNHPAGGDATMDEEALPTEEIERNNRVATTVVERISDNSSAILKGAYVSSRQFKEKSVLVEVTVTKASVKAAAQVRAQMSGAM